MALSSDTVKNFERFARQTGNLLNERKANKVIFDWTGFEGYGTQKSSFVPTSYTPVKKELLDAISTVQPLIENIVDKVKDLEEKISTLEKSILSMKETEIFEVIASETSVEVPKEEAKEMIIKLFEDQGELDYIDIVKTLNLDLELVVKICEDLEQEKKIGAIN